MVTPVFGLSCRNKIIAKIAITTCCCVLLAGCCSILTDESPTYSPKPENVSFREPTATNTSTFVMTATRQPTATEPAPHPTVTPSPSITASPVPSTSAEEFLAYKDLPEIKVWAYAPLVPAPSHPYSYLPVDPIPGGESVRVIARDSDGAWLLVLYGNIVGWMPSVFSGSGVGALQLVEVATSTSEECTSYLGATLGPDEMWLSSTNGKVTVKGIVYRPQLKERFGASSLAVEIGGTGRVIESDSNLVALSESSEVILLTFVLEDLHLDSRIGFRFPGFANEPFSFLAAFFDDECPDDEGRQVAAPPPASKVTRSAYEPTSTPIVVTRGPGQGSSSAQAVVEADVLNVRDGPGTHYAKIDKVQKGDRLVVHGRNQAADWLKIATPGGKNGWVAAEYVKATRLVSSFPVVATPRPPARPAIDPKFRADHTQIASGQCTTLRWDVDGVKLVHLNGVGKPGHGKQQVCPAQTQTFTLIVTHLDGKRTDHLLTIQVSGQAVYQPLTIEYKLNGAWCASKSEWIAEFEVRAQGGDGTYTYFRDIDKIGGPLRGAITYQFRCGLAAAATGTFRVKSGDGQEASSESFHIKHPHNCK